MILVTDIFTLLFLIAGLIIILIGGIGIIRLPDFYSRTHAVSLVDTLGILLIITGLIINQGFSLNSLKLILIYIFIAIANPVASHAISKAALDFGIKPLLKKIERKK